jgi:hypothetical protein
MKHKTIESQLVEKFKNNLHENMVSLGEAELQIDVSITVLARWIESLLEEQRKEIEEENEDDQVSWEGFESGLF